MLDCKLLIMILKVILISIVLLALALLGFGVKLLFDRNAELPKSSCQSANDSGSEFGCACGAGVCAKEEVKA